MRTMLKQTKNGAVEIWQGHQQRGTIYATPAGLTIQIDTLETKDLDLDTSGPPTLHVTIREWRTSFTNYLAIKP
jgi:hypothetical protein